MVETKDASKDTGKFRQFLAAVIVNLSAISYGIVCGWPSPMIPLLSSNATLADNPPMNEEEASWIGALLCLGGLSLTPFTGILADILGRKKFGYVTCIPLIVSWLMTIFATNYHWLYAARFVAGMGGAMSIFLVPIYVSEVASEEIRGALGSLLVFAINIGIWLAFVTGPFMPYVAFNSFAMIFPIIFVLAFIFVPETPIYLLRNNRLIDAKRSLLYFRGNNKNLADQELARLQQQTNNAASCSKKPGLSDLIRDRATFKGMIISFGLMGGQQLSGIFAMISYAETIFKMAGSSLSPATAAIIIGAIQVFGSYLSTILMERAGRRLLILASCAGMCICHFVVGSFCYFQNLEYDLSSISWIPIVALSIYMITYCLGMGPGPFVVSSEIFRPEISSLANTVALTFLWGAAFTVIKTFGPIMEVIGIDGCFFVLGTFCALTYFFVYVMLPETKGRKTDDIVDELSGVRRPNSYYIESRYISDKDLMAGEQV